MEFTELQVLSFLISSALVFIMVPGLALFYGGLVRHKNVIGTMMHSITAIGLVSVLWVLWGYSLAFGNSVGGLGFVGDLTKFGMIGVELDEQAFMVFQGMFAIITVALIAGGFAERFKFSSYIIFSALWVTIVYAPLCHWVWGGGWLGNLGSVLGMSEAGVCAGLRRRHRGAYRIGGPQRWQRPSSWGAAPGLGRQRLLRTTCPWCCWAPACCGSAGSASTRAAVSTSRAARA